MVVGLRYNLLRYIQLCDKGNNVTIYSFGCMVIKSKSHQTTFTSFRDMNTYIVNLNKIPSNDVCLISNEEKSWISYRRITHIHMEHLNKLSHKDLAIGFPNMHFEKSQLYDACRKAKKVRSSLKSKKVVSKNVISTNWTL